MSEYHQNETSLEKDHDSSDDGTNRCKSDSDGCETSSTNDAHIAGITTHNSNEVRQQPEEEYEKLGCGSVDSHALVIENGHTDSSEDKLQYNKARDSTLTDSFKDKAANIISSSFSFLPQSELECEEFKVTKEHRPISVATDSFKNKAVNTVAESFSFLPQTSVELDVDASNSVDANVQSKDDQIEDQSLRAALTANSGLSDSFKSRASKHITDSFSFLANPEFSSDVMDQEQLPSVQNGEVERDCCNDKELEKKQVSSEQNEVEKDNDKELENESFKKRASKHITDSFSFLANVDSDDKTTTSQVDTSDDNEGTKSSRASIMRSSEKRESIKKLCRTNSRKAILSHQGDQLQERLDDELRMSTNLDNQTTCANTENEDGKPKISSTSPCPDKTDQLSPIIMRSPKPRRSSHQASPTLQRLRSRSGSRSEGSDDEEEEEEEGFYAESFRYSSYIFVGDDEEVNISASASSPNLATLGRAKSSPRSSPRKFRYPSGTKQTSPKVSRSQDPSKQEQQCSANERLSSISDASSDLSSGGGTLDRTEALKYEKQISAPEDYCAENDPPPCSTPERRGSSPFNSLHRQSSSPASTMERPGSLSPQIRRSSPRRSEDMGDSNQGIYLKAPQHHRSESTSTTASEKEFRTRYQARSTKKVQRSDSTITYKRMSSRFYEVERMVHVVKNSEDKDFGFHVRGNAPIIVSTVEKDSPAERGGLKVGDVLLEVNDINVAEKSVQELREVITKDTEKILLCVASDKPALDKLSPGSALFQGYLMKQGGLIKSWKKRWVSLDTDNCLYYYKSKNDTDPLGAILLNMYSVTKATDINRPHTFRLSKFAAKTYCFQAKDDNEMSEWAGKIREAADNVKKEESWLAVSSHNVTLPACSIRDPCCFGYLTKLGNRHKTWKKRYCVLKDACMYYYTELTSSMAQGVAHFHGYKVEAGLPYSKKYGFTLIPPEEKMRTFYFYADTPAAAERWIRSLKKSIGHWVKVDR